MVLSKALAVDIQPPEDKFRLIIADNIVQGKFPKRHWDAAALGCRGIGMSRHWDAAALGCRGIGMSRHWDAAALGCRFHGAGRRRPTGG